MLGDDTDEVRQQSCVKSLLQSPLLSAASVEQSENKTDRYGQTIPFFSSAKRTHPPSSLSPSGKLSDTWDGLVKSL